MSNYFIILLHLYTGVKMFHHIAWAMKAQTPDALSQWLLVILADHADNAGTCFPSQKTLSNRTGMGTSTINRKLIMLEDAGLITRKSGHQGRSTRYYLCVPEWDIPVPEREYHVPERDTKLPVNYTNNIEGWNPSEKLTQQIDNISGAINHDLEANKFKDYCLANGKQYKDIDAAYRNWCRNVIKFATEASTRQTTSTRKYPLQSNKQSGEILRAVSGLGYKVQ